MGADQGVRVRQLTSAEFSEFQDTWCQLIEQSDADPLFSGWCWQYQWWHNSSAILDAELRILIAVNAKNEVVGIAPLYVHAVRIKGILPIRRVELIGNVFRGNSLTRSEYLGFILRQDSVTAAWKAIIGYLLELDDWHELVLTDVALESVSYMMSRTFVETPQLFRRESDEDVGYSVDLSVDFEAFLSSVGPNGRRHIYNKRAKLHERGEVSLVDVDVNGLDEFFVQLNRLNALRWEKPSFNARQMEFHRLLVSGPTQQQHFIAASLLCLNGEPISALYDIDSGRRRYNIQSGFDPNFIGGISLGLLHFGYAIENAIRSGMCSYELLLGGGMRERYKDIFRGKRISVTTVQKVRPAWLKLIYKLYA